MNATYVVMNLNASTTPVFFRQGLCMPDQCSQNMYNEFGTKATTKVTAALRGLLKKLHIDVYVAPPDVVMELTFIKTSTILDKYSESEDGVQLASLGKNQAGTAEL